jgi:hypothetical protein
LTAAGRQRRVVVRPGVRACAEEREVIRVKLEIKKVEKILVTKPKR